MSLALKMLQGGTTPTLYNFYGKQYDYNDLAKAADLGLNEYLATLKRGDKDSNEFMNAYTNLMSGIKDGSITFDNGRFHDSQGRYTNSDKKNRDYYGLVANYIYSKMGLSDAYQKPEDPSKISWGNDSVRTALMRLLYNSDNGNLNDFLDLDKEKDGVRGITNRSAYLAKALQAVADNWDTTFQGYLDADKSRYVPLLLNAAKALQDGTIDPGDYLALSKAVGGMDFREMMATGTPTTSTPTTLATPQATPQATQEQVQTPQVKTKHAALFDKAYNNKVIGRMSAVMARVPTRGLINILRNSFYNRSYRFGSDPRIEKIFRSNKISSKAGITATLNALYAQGVLQHADSSNPNLYYIPGLKTKNGTGWVWDKASNTITEMYLDKIPYAKLRLLQEQQALQVQQETTPGLYTTYTQAHKLGGILKALNGTQLPFYSGITDFDPSKYSAIWGSTRYGIDDKGNYGEKYGNSGKGQDNARYVTDPRFQDYTLKGKEYALAIENQPKFKNFTDTLLSSAKDYMDASDKSTFNDQNNAFLNWSHGYDKGLPAGSTATFFDSNGNLRTSWKVTNRDSYQRGPREAINDVYERIKALRNDLLLADGHNDLMREGTRYFYKDNNGTQHWVDPEVAKSGKYKVSTNGIKSTEGITNWTDYELTGLANGGSDIDRRQETNKPNWFLENGLRLYENLAPLAVGAARLRDSLHTNNKVADVMKKATKPDLLNTYELYSPVTGAFSEMQLRNRLAADLRRLAAQPYTSDASLNEARSLEANKLATDLEYQGFLADDKEIKRTQEEALKRQEDNIARRTDVANKNRASINNTNRQLAEIEAGRLKSNWQSRDNYLQGIESDLKGKKALREYDERLERLDNKLTSLSLDLADLQRSWDVKERNIKNRYEDLLKDEAANFLSKVLAFAKAKGVDPEDADYTGEQFYKDYVAKVRSLRDAQYQELDKAAQDRSDEMKQYINGIRNKMGRSSLFKHGGSLSPSILSLLHKAMH